MRTRSIARLTLLALWGMFAPLAAAGQFWPLYYSGNPEYPPYHWCKAHKLLTGASVEQLRQVVPAHYQLVPMLFPWKRVLLQAENGQLDIILPLRINAERARYLRFSKHPAFENPIVVFMRKDKPISYQGWESLKPFRGGVSLGDVFGGGFDEYLAANLTIDVGPDMASNFRKLELGRIDYFITGKYVGMAYLQKQKMHHQITSLPQPVSVGKIHLAFTARVPQDLIDHIDTELKRMAENGESAALLRKWAQLYANSPGHLCS